METRAFDIAAILTHYIYIIKQFIYLFIHCYQAHDKTTEASENILGNLM